MTAASAPSEETVQDGTYTPLGRPLFIYVEHGHAEERRGLKAFVDYYLDNVNDISPQVGFIPLTDEQLVEGRGGGRRQLGGAPRKHDAGERHRGLRPGGSRRSRGWRPRVRATARRSSIGLLAAMRGDLGRSRRPRSSSRCSCPRSSSSGRCRSATSSSAPTGGRPSTPPSFGVLPIVVGTLSVTFWWLLFAIPIGLGSAIYLSEYASPRVPQVRQADPRGAGRRARPSPSASSPSSSSPRQLQTIWPGFLGGATAASSAPSPAVSRSG